jgi:hypothetical protein
MRKFGRNIKLIGRRASHTGALSSPLAKSMLLLFFEKKLVGLIPLSPQGRRCAVA